MFVLAVAKLVISRGIVELSAPLLPVLVTAGRGFSSTWAVVSAIDHHLHLQPLPEAPHRLVGQVV